MDEIRRKVERYLCGKLSAEMGSHKFYSMNGGGETDDATEIEPPFTFLTIVTAEKVVGYEGQWMLTGAAQVCTHMAEATPTQHSELARTVYHFLGGLTPEATENMVFHGIDISGVRTSEEDSNKIRVDAIDFTAGVGG